MEVQESITDSKYSQHFRNTKAYYRVYNSLSVFYITKVS